jgi:hypothetical protein
VSLCGTEDWGFVHNCEFSVLREWPRRGLCERVEELRQSLRESEMGAVSSRDAHSVLFGEQRAFGVVLASHRKRFRRAALSHSF